MIRNLKYFKTMKEIKRVGKDYQTPGGREITIVARANETEPLSPMGAVVFETKRHLKQVPGTLLFTVNAVLSFGRASSRQARSEDLKELACPISLKRQS